MDHPRRGLKWRRRYAINHVQCDHRYLVGQNPIELYLCRSPGPKCSIGLVDDEPLTVRHGGIYGEKVLAEKMAYIKPRENQILDAG